MAEAVDLEKPVAHFQVECECGWRSPRQLALLAERYDCPLCHPPGEQKTAPRFPVPVAKAGRS